MASSWVMAPLLRSAKMPCVRTHASTRACLYSSRVGSSVVSLSSSSSSFGASRGMRTVDSKSGIPHFSCHMRLSSCHLQISSCHLRLSSANFALSLFQRRENATKTARDAASRKRNTPPTQYKRPFSDFTSAFAAINSFSAAIAASSSAAAFSSVHDRHSRPCGLAWSSFGRIFSHIGSYVSSVSRTAMCASYHTPVRSLNTSTPSEYQSDATEACCPISNSGAM